MPTPKIVFLLESDNTLRDLIRISLLRGGYEVIAEKNPIRFLEMANNRNVDLFVIDLFIPGYDALGLITEIKTNQPNASVPVIALSVYGFEEIIVETIKLGVVDFILKPFDTDMFLEKVARWVK